MLSLSDDVAARLGVISVVDCSGRGSAVPTGHIPRGLAAGRELARRHGCRDTALRTCPIAFMCSALIGSAGVVVDYVRAQTPHHALHAALLRPFLPDRVGFLLEATLQAWIEL